MLSVQYFTFNPFEENTYVLYDETKEAVIIDPGCCNREEERELSDWINEVTRDEIIAAFMALRTPGAVMLSGSLQSSPPFLEILKSKSLPWSSIA